MSVRRLLCLRTILYLLIMVSCSAAWAQDSKSDTPQADESTADDDSQVLSFVQQHQPEMAKLMVFLKNKKPNDYKKALRESRKVRDRLQTLRDRDSDLYEVELALWKTSAELRLLAAAVSAKGQKLEDADRQKLQELVTQEHQLTIKRLTLEKARAEARVNQLTQQLAKRQEQSDSLISKGFKTWENRIERSVNKSKK